MTETEQKLIDDLRPRLDNWRRAYRDRVVKNVSIAYAVERALALTRNKTDFSEDYTEDDGNSGLRACEIDMKDADLLNFTWQNMATPETEVLSVGTHGLNVRTAKLIVLLYVFGSQYSLSRAGKKIWNIKRRKLDHWTQDALLFFALKLRYFEQINERKDKKCDLIGA